MEKRPIAYQVYSAREEAEKNLSGVLGQLAGMGYNGVEFAGFYGIEADEIISLLAKYNLQAISSHVPVALIEEDMFAVLSYHRKIGCEYIAIPFLDEQTRPGAPGFARMIQLIYKFGKLCRRAGIQLLYHNHDFEFVQLSGQYALDFLYEAVPETILQTEIDTCWVKYAGEDPAAYVRKYAGRCPVVHLKDYVGEKGDASPYGLLGEEEKAADSGKTAFEFRPYGHGVQDAEGVVAAGIESGAKWFVVEQDLSIGRTPLEAAAMSIETLRKMGATD
ncbi:sugar phosphate isomerase/epimerase [Eubacteriales bacterium OttesenSCG-928-A19]|nr:sugar phosphate isomerase/epimerase [Eubacteriales bacterium OttesenSCG-928-A19]